MLGHRRREMSELHELQRAIWGDVAYTHDLAAARSERRARLLAHALFATGVAAVSLGIAVLGLALVSAGRQWSDLATGVVPPASVTPAPTRPPPAPTAPTAPPTATDTSRRPLTTGAPSTVKVTQSPTRRRPPLPHTGGATNVLFGVAIAFLGAGIGLVRRPRRPTGSS